MEEDLRKGSGGKRKWVVADDSEEDRRKTRSMAEPDWVGWVMGGYWWVDEDNGREWEEGGKVQVGPRDEA